MDAQTNPPLLSATDLSRPDIPLIPKLSLVLQQGEILALQGPSGSGKSTQLRALADLDVTSGTVDLQGQDRDTIPATTWRQKVHYIPAESGWWEETVADHMPRHDLARSLLPKLDRPSDAMAWPISRLSTGERQRLALIRGLSLQPDVLLLDEPTASLDDMRRDQAEALLIDFTKRGGAIILVSHDHAQIDRLAHRVVDLAAGGMSP